jgi:hypothetical protein
MHAKLLTATGPSLADPVPPDQNPDTGTGTKGDREDEVKPKPKPAG